MDDTEQTETPGTPKADHFCVLVPGLWGNPGHLANLKKCIEKEHGEKLHVLVAKRNSDTYTYDGIEVGGERVAQEIEDELQELEKQGYKITKMSIVGYSLGGLIARYSIGLLFKGGWFDKITPVNFTAFASPFLGVRTPVKGYHSTVWNALGSRTLSASGSQLFLTDKFRDTGRPLISILADPDSIFIQGLATFKNRVLYANITNDRSAPWYTTGISRSDPFEDLNVVKLNPLPGYAKVLLDPDNPVSVKPEQQMSLYSRAAQTGSSVLNKLPFYAAMTIFAPIGTTAFLISAGIQTVRSGKRVKLHNEGDSSSPFQSYRIPVLERAIDALNAAEPQEHLETSDSEDSTKEGTSEEAGQPTQKALYRSRSRPEFPVLALTPEQFEMIETLNNVGFKKYPVYISLVNHSHAAIIVRMNRDGFKEGYEVIRHWLTEEFEL